MSGDKWKCPRCGGPDHDCWGPFDRWDWLITLIAFLPVALFLAWCMWAGR